MKTRHSRFFLIVLLVSLLGATAIACPPPSCPECQVWGGSSCVWNCGPSDYCCGISGSRTCCSNECCERGTSCCTSSTAECCGFDDRCCDTDCCMNTCCPSGQRCCGVGCCSNSNACCGGTCCSPGYTCCGSALQNCCVGECCGGTQCCGAIGKLCCEDTACYDDATEKCCGDGLGTFCDDDVDCCDGSCCLAWQSCCDGECTDVCWTTEDEHADYEPCGCILGICGDYYFEWPDKTMCVPAGAGWDGHCKCIEKTDVIKKTWDCEGDWDEDKMFWCAAYFNICSLSCNPLLPSYDPASCAECLGMSGYDCCDGEDCGPCDFRDCHKEEGTLDETLGLVFDRFEGDTCNNDPF
jgi:hypothetical protein